MIDTETYQIYGVEALLRFHDQELKEVYPSQFIPLLEKSGLIILVGKWVIEQSSIMYQKLKQYRPDLNI